ncbi:Gfo/Idh/MocA family protein [Christiangramia crocea]|uniref:Gfo/Idh/MocA family oxidoreductase n=1 Tax=Christiangramia crocea TaxID=2904124 RepID=A0A9X2A7A6_9FLAO|nr:Gfo/Idh/MocA family oxidoreductase [Gramella crocea]MCG9972840.1 Gfo/Idh/MocA family oxidoreductase [Gramella crocea]
MHKDLKIKWGIIGCGDVVRKKSGPAFNKNNLSELIAVMSRDGIKAKKFAKILGAEKHFDNVETLLKDREISAVYIATPPSTHAELAIQALEAGKNVYLEKPMALSSKEVSKIIKVLNTSECKLTIAHYRRRLPAFLKVKKLIDSGAIGEIRFADIRILQPLKSDLIAMGANEDWRIKPEISGGGYFHDLAPHQLDLMLLYFGNYRSYCGISGNQSSNYEADDYVNGLIRFENGIHFRGIWSFNMSVKESKDECLIYGSKGYLKFSFFGEKLELVSDSSHDLFHFRNPKYVQQPMIEATVDYFLDNGPNPCSAEEGLMVMKIMDGFCNNND